MPFSSCICCATRTVNLKIWSESTVSSCLTRLHALSSFEVTWFISASFVRAVVRASGCVVEQSFSVGEKLRAPVCSSDQLDMLSCRDGAMQHCQQAPVSNEFSTAVLFCSEGGKLFIQYNSHLRIRHGHPLPQHHLFRWTFFPLWPCYFYLWPPWEAEYTVSLQMHLTFVSLSVNCLPHLAFCCSSLHQCRTVSIYKDRHTDEPQLLTCWEHLSPHPLLPLFCRCLIVAGLPRTVLTVPAAQQGRLLPLCLWSWQVSGFICSPSTSADTDGHGLK